MTAARPQKLDRFKPLIHERQAAYPALSAERLFAECRAAGYVVRATRLRDYVASVHSLGTQNRRRFQAPRWTPKTGHSWTPENRPPRPMS
jgi:hypothetical protein